MASRMKPNIIHMCNHMFYMATSIGGISFTKKILESVLCMDELKIATPRNRQVLNNVKNLLAAQGSVLCSIETVMLGIKQEVS